MSDKTQCIERTLILKSTIDRVWDAITNPEQLSQWFGQTAQFTLKQGNIGHFGWDEHGSFAIRIEKVTPKTLFSWRWMPKKDEPFEEKGSTLVEWKLKPIANGGTELYLKESGFLSEQSHQDNIGGWKEELQHLLDFLK